MAPVAVFAQSNSARATLLNPKQYQVVPGHSVTVRYMKVNVTGSEHLHLQLDTQPEIHDTNFTGSYRFQNVTDGQHRITGYLANNSDHTKISGTDISVTFIMDGSVIAIGDRIQATNSVNVRASPSLTGVILGTQSTGAQGTVLGATPSTDHTWWQINYNTGVDGWSVHDYLDKQQSSSKPNIVVIMTDDQDDRGTLDVMANVKSLLLDKGVRFKNNFVVNPLCCPSRATFLTGQYSHNDNVWTNGNTYDGRGGGYSALLPTADNTLPVWLERSGYYTGLIGKYLNGYGRAVSPTNIPPGWNTWHGLVDPSTYSFYNYTVNENGVLRTYGSSTQDYQTDVLSRKAVDFINARMNSTQPFFLWLTPLAPHAGTPGAGVPEPAQRHRGLFSSLPLPQPPNFNESDFSDKPQFMKDHLPLMGTSSIDFSTKSYRLRRESLLAVDEMVADVLNALQEAGKLDNTYIIFTSDNGYFQGEHRVPVDKLLVYEESIRVPLIIRGPDIPANETRNQLVSNVDLPATILELTQATAGRVQDGQSIMPFVNSTSSLGRTALLLEGMNKIALDTTFYGFYSAVRTNRYVYIEHTLPGGVTKENEFYDLLIDPHELLSSVNDSAYATVISNLKQMLNFLEDCRGVLCWIDW